MRVLIVTRIFPSCVRPEHAPYNRMQFGELSRLCDVRLLALRPWLPGGGWLRRSPYDGLPRQETLDGQRVEHPRVLYAPGPARPLSGLLYVASLWPRVRAERGRVDLVLGSFAYPDGWAAVALGRLLGVPAVIKLHGSDVHVYGRDPLLRGQLRLALRHAAAVVAPSQQLVDEAVALGAEPRLSRAVPNGVDQRLFRLRERDACRLALGHSRDRNRWLLFVGRVERQKGVLELLQAFATVAANAPDARLVLVGEGDDRARCEAFAREHELPVLFAGARPPADVALWMGASDVVTLPSWAEGTPNVVLEALACGRRVVATDVGGIPAVIHEPLLGELVPPRAPERLAQALLRAIVTPPPPAVVRERAATISWHQSATLLLRVLEQAAGVGTASGAGRQSASSTASSSNAVDRSSAVARRRWAARPGEAHVQAE
jgi:teichuronic acid biosynthesis glycosyltransferase TuaC